jgi:pilus assembly protein CpaE
VANQIAVAVVSPSRDAQAVIGSALEKTPEVRTLWALSDYLTRTQLSELPEQGCIIFLDFSDRASAEALASEVDARFPNIGVIAMFRETRPQDLLDLMQFGVREVIGLPPEETHVQLSFARMHQRLKQTETGSDPQGRIFAFMPAKPGVGATTLAIHASAFVPRLAEVRTLLLDFDFRLGLTSFMLKLESRYSIMDALSSIQMLDVTRWDQFVSHLGQLDILGSAPLQFRGVDPEEGTQSLLKFVRQLYPTVCVDLPGEMRTYEIETIRDAAQCYLVCTPDITSIHLAKAKTDLLRSLGLGQNVTVILNRTGGRMAISAKDIETILKVPVRFSVMSAEKEFAEATKSGKVLQGSAPVVAQIENIARSLLPPDLKPQQKVQKRKFLEFFSPPVNAGGGSAYRGANG